MCILLFLAMFFMVLNGFVYTIAVNIYAYRLAFSSILPCVQHQNALHLAANSPKSAANCGFMQCVFILSASTTAPLLHPNKPSRESDFCGRVGGWWPKTALIMLKNVLKILHRVGRCTAFTHFCTPILSCVRQIYHTYAIVCFCVSS